jgi:hypothetical protein
MDLDEVDVRSLAVWGASVVVWLIGFFDFGLGGGISA